LQGPDCKEHCGDDADDGDDADGDDDDDEWAIVDNEYVAAKSQCFFAIWALQLAYLFVNRQRIFVKINILFKSLNFRETY